MPATADRASDALPEAAWECRPGRFPSGAQWEITPERATAWLRSMTVAAGDEATWRRSSRGLDAGEFRLFLWDLELYRGWQRRYVLGQAAQPPPPIDRYLLAGREDWGWIGRMVRELREGWNG